MLEHLGLIGVSWRQGGSEALAEFACPGASGACSRLRAPHAALASSPTSPPAIASRSFSRAASGRRPRTCGATRSSCSRAAPPRDGEAERRLRAWQGEGAAEHLFLIAAGLDSACVGETEIVGQVRYAQERALELGLCGPSLGLVFEEALRIAGRVRGETKLGEGRVSLAEIAVQQLRERIARTPGRIALIGVSPMTERAAVSLAQAGLEFTVVNRSADKAAALAARFGAPRDARRFSGASRRRRGAVDRDRRRGARS